MDAPSQRKVAILVIDDDHLVRRVVCRLLSRQGYSVLEAATAAQAMEQLEQSGAVPDLLVSDMVMPGISGHDLIAQIRGKHPAIKVLLMSGYTRDVLLERQWLTPKDFFIEKCNLNTDLIGVVKSLL